MRNKGNVVEVTHVRIRDWPKHREKYTKRLIIGSIGGDLLVIRPLSV